LKQLTPENLRRHRIITVPQRPIVPLAVYLLNISNSGMIAEYRVRIGEYRVYVKVLNLPVKSTFKGRVEGKGYFGVVLEKSVATQKFVAKVQQKMDKN
jgi:mRNA-degrading endonuclease RelE of RelBE toxin-antitoxin system